MEGQGAIPKPADRQKLINWLKGKPGALGRDGESNSQRPFYYSYYLASGGTARGLEEEFRRHGGPSSEGQPMIANAYTQMFLICRDAEMQAVRHPSQLSGRLMAEAWGVTFK